jgi:23S rRNA (guanosine2251-2'-O)-methyltransferase
MIPKKQDVRLLLDNIRSVHNVGSIFRTAETLGISRIYCSGTTPTPVDRFAGKRKDFAKVALGAEDLVEWEHVGGLFDLAGKVVDCVGLVRSLKKEGFEVIALEQNKNSVDYKSIKLKAKANENSNRGAIIKTLIILGNEVEGVSPRLLKLSDVIAEIPLKGKKESLNVSVAAGIFLYRLLDK